MKQSGDSRFSSEPELEVELSAQDLLSLTPPTATPVRQLEVVTPHRSQPAEMVAAVTTGTSSTRAFSAPMRVPSLRVMAAAGVVIVAVMATGALFAFAPPQRVVERPQSNWAPVPDPIPVAAEAPPTLVTNPFDASEVFELPPGISRDEARAMVAELLLNRANERKVYSQKRR